MSSAETRLTGREKVQEFAIAEPRESFPRDFAAGLIAQAQSHSAVGTNRSAALFGSKAHVSDTVSIERYLWLGEKNAHHATDCSAVRKPRNRLRLPSRFEATAVIPAALAALRTS